MSCRTSSASTAIRKIQAAGTARLFNADREVLVGPDTSGRHCIVAARTTERRLPGPETKRRSKPFALLDFPIRSVAVAEERQPARPSCSPVDVLGLAESQWRGSATGRRRRDNPAPFACRRALGLASARDQGQTQEQQTCKNRDATNSGVHEQPLIIGRASFHSIFFLQTFYNIYIKCYPQHFGSQGTVASERSKKFKARLRLRA